MKSEKDLSVYQLFETLQKEYVVCELRAKIYPIIKHKEYWKQTAAMKKDKIIDIAKRNCLPSIFDDKRIKRDYELRIYNKVGLPNFYYPNELKKEQQKNWDIINYFWPGTEVKFYDETEIRIAMIKSFDLDSMALFVTCDGDDIQVNIDSVSRIL